LLKGEERMMTRKCPAKKYMVLALHEAAKNLKSMAGGPFGACIVRNNKVLSIARNTVLKKKDATCHAEINAIRIASGKLKTFDLSGCAIYSTTEPCPMCFSAIHWSRIGTIVYGTAISDAKEIGFNELSIPDTRMKVLGKSKTRLIRGFMRDKCLKLLRNWNTLPNRVFY